MSRNQRHRRDGARSAGPDVQTLFAAAVREHVAGRLPEADQLYRRILAAEPRHAESLHRLGIIGYQTGQFAPAVEHLRRAIAADPGVAAYHTHLSLALASLGRLDEAAQAGAAAVQLSPEAPDAQVNLALILMQLGRYEEAVECSRRAVALAPQLADAHSNLGAGLQALGRLAEAAAAFRRALEIEPDYAEAHTGLGAVLLELGQADKAAAHHRRALALRPGFADAHSNLGQALRQLSRLDEAAEHLARAIRSDPAHVVAYVALGGVLKAWGRLTEAEACLSQALALAPDQPEVLNNLALTLLAQGRPGEATQAIARALAVRETPGARAAFVECIKNLQVESGGLALRPLLLRALREGWGRPESLARVALHVASQETALAASVARANAAWPGPPSEAELYGEGGVTAIMGDGLLEALLVSTPNMDMRFERFLTLARLALLDVASAGPPGEAGAPLRFYAALARQCFLNEYVFRLTDAEAERVDALARGVAGALAAGEPIDVVSLLAVACYRPLASLPLAERLLERSWPGAAEAVVRQQVGDLLEEARLQAEIPRLTRICDDGSLRVRSQYEQNPYPRWSDSGAGEPRRSLADHLMAAFPLSGLQPPSGGAQPEILVAGCGTGRNALDTARMFEGGRTLAIDLSLASLAHALRKSREAQVADLTFAQADLLEVGSLGRSFDMIEAVGVLHHLADPFAGWRALLAVLRPGGVMKLGLYSALARRKLPQTTGLKPTHEVIRALRQEIAARDDEEARQAVHAQDFYSLSGCRDLLFHVQETRLSLGEIAGFLSAEGLRFLGFALPPLVLAAYQRRFPDDPGAVDLEGWEAFERDNPDTFAEMYQFWVQKG